MRTASHDGIYVDKKTNEWLTVIGAVTTGPHPSHSEAKRSFDLLEKVLGRRGKR